MKGFVAVLALGLVACVHGQQCAEEISQIPECARTCAQEASAAIGCDPQDLQCQCEESNAASIQTEAIPCVLANCQQQDLLAAQAAAGSVCQCAASLPAESEPTATEAPEATVTSEPADAPVEATPVLTTTAIVDPPFPTASGTRPGGNNGTAPTGTAPGKPSATSSTVPGFTGAAVHVAGSVGGVIGAFAVAMLAL